jgi:hypothetical protein
VRDFCYARAHLFIGGALASCTRNRATIEPDCALVPSWTAGELRIPVFHKAAAQDLRKQAPIARYVLDLFDGNTRLRVRDGKSGADFSDR